MTVPVNLNLSMKTIQVDIQNQSISLTFVFDKFGTPQTATLQAGADFTAVQFSTLVTQMENLFQKWVQRQ